MYVCMYIIFLAGHWIGDPCEFVQLSCLCMPELYYSHVKDYGYDVAHNELISVALSHCFASTVAQAYNQGLCTSVELSLLYE